ncbi:MFS transporter [Streptomyces sp. SD31]|uniref:MFS transporter n=1 Tax=Streptomyces sp. SD31 TaxID=3452208 RepID=UPI003F8BE8AF
MRSVAPVRVAVAAAQLCNTVPSPINGEMQAAFVASGSQVAWVTSGFILLTAILELNSGALGDLFGRKRLLVLGGLVLALGELLNATAQNITMLWIGQALAGVGAAALGRITIAVGLTALLWGVTEGGERGWGSPAIVGSLVLAAVALIGFVVAELRAESPMFNLELLRIPSFAAAAVVALVGMFGLIGTGRGTDRCRSGPPRRGRCGVCATGD